MQKIRYFTKIRLVFYELWNLNKGNYEIGKSGRLADLL